MDVRKESYMLISSGSDRVKKLRLKLMKNLKYFRLLIVISFCKTIYFVTLACLSR